MLIRSQDKLKLVNANRIIVSETEVVNYVSYTNEAEDYDVLGTYKTQQRAIEVLTEIEDYFNSIEQLKRKNISFIKNVFHMPES